MTLKTQVAHGLKWQAIEIIVRQVLSLIVFTALARLLEPSAFGKVALVGVYMAFIAMFADQGIATFEKGMRRSLAWLNFAGFNLAR